MIGAGGYGTALACTLNAEGHEVRLWARRPEFARTLVRRGENTTYLPGVPLDPAIEPTSDAQRALDGAHAAILAVPSQAVRGTLETFRTAGAAWPEVAVSVAKGLELGSLRRMSEIGAEYGISFVQLSGPSHAEEVARGEPTAVVLAHPEEAPRLRAQEILGSRRFRPYTSSDRTGVELAGALKNVLALASGISEGLGVGDNLRAVLLTRGLAEITRLGVAAGAQAATFAGLAGLGDLLATAFSPHSRNRRTGIALGRGESLESILRKSPMVIEGVPATETALALSQRAGVELPIAQSLGRILFSDADPAAEMHRLLERTFKEE